MKTLSSNEIQQVSGGHFDLSIGFDFGVPLYYYDPYPVFYDPYPLYAPIYLGTETIVTEVVTPVCDRFGCYNLVERFVDTVDYYY